MDAPLILYNVFIVTDLQPCGHYIINMVVLQYLVSIDKSIVVTLSDESPCISQ